MKKSQLELQKGLLVLCVIFYAFAFINLALEIFNGNSLYDVSKYILFGLASIPLYFWYVFLQRKRPEIEEEIKKKLKLHAERAETEQQQELIRLEAGKQKELKLESIRSQCNHEPVVANVMGGSGWNFIKGEELLLSIRAESIHLCNILTMKEINILFPELVGAEVTGPGTETSNAGIIGGGFGIEGAAKGILAATVINVLTTRTKTNTYLRLSTSSAEMMLHITALDPTELRLLLSSAFVKIEANKKNEATQKSHSDTMLSDEIVKLHRMFQGGILTEEEFVLAKTGLLSKGDKA